MWRRAPVHSSEHNRHREGSRRWTALGVSALAAVASLVTMTAFAASASAHDAPPSGTGSCQSFGPTYDWQVVDGSTFVENTSGAQWALTFTSSAGTITSGTATGTGDTSTGPGFTVTDIGSAVAFITVTTHLVWGTPPAYSAGSSTEQATIGRPINGCAQSVAIPAAPTVTPPTCSAVGSLQIPTDTATVTWSVVPNYHTGDTGPFTVTATARSGYVFTDTKTTETYPVTVAGKVTGSPCYPVIAPVRPSVALSTCTGPGTQSGATLTIPSTPGVVYTISGAVVSGTTITEQPGTSVTVVATPAFGFKFTGVQERDYHLKFGTAGSCLMHTAPVTPASTNGACTTPGQHSHATLTIPTTQHVIYTIGGIGSDVSGQVLTERVGSTVDVVATPAAGYRFRGPQSVTDSITFKDVGNCLVGVTAAKPGFTNAECRTDSSVSTATYTIPATKHVSYRVNGKPIAAGTHSAANGTTITVTAIADIGYSMQVTMWTHTFGASPTCHAVIAHHVQRIVGLASTGVATKSLILSGSALALLGMVFLMAGGYRPRKTRR